ncbi:MAG: alpha/beta fold hydrolase [Acidobacteriota bacterium]
MSRGRVVWGITLSAFVLIILLLAAITVYVLAKVTFPERRTSVLTPRSLFLDCRDVKFQTADGVGLAGYYVPADGSVPIILCHDFGWKKEDMLALAAMLHEAGYPALLFDFRHHGKSGGGMSTLGAREKLDVLAAVEFLKSSGKGGKIGLLGVSMGAYAGALAATEVEELAALVLVDPYPNLSLYFHDRVEELFNIDRGPLPWILEHVFTAYTHTTGDQWALDRALPGLSKKAVLFVSSHQDPRNDQYCRDLYDITPEPKELTAIDGFQKAMRLGTEKDQVRTRVIRFFNDFLPGSARPPKVIKARPGER